MEITDAVKNKLFRLGYQTQGVDFPALADAIGRAEEILRAKTNQKVLPEGLFYILADMAAGFFLQTKKAAGELDEIYDFSAAASPAKSISEGDTSVTFAVSDAASFGDAFDAMLKSMVTPPEDCIVAHRRLVW